MAGLREDSKISGATLTMLGFWLALLTEQARGRGLAVCVNT